MFKHRIAFVGAWLALAVALLAYPGIEARSFFMGMIVGAWPFLLLGHWVYAYKGIVIVGTLLLSGVPVGLCGWAADVTCQFKRTWIVLLAAIAAGAAIAYLLNDYSFEDWKSSPAITAATEAGELSHEPTREEYYESITLPKTLAGAMWGLYLAAASSFVYSIVLSDASRRANGDGQLQSPLRFVLRAREQEADRG